MLCYTCGKGITQYDSVVGLDEDGEVSAPPVPLGSTEEPAEGWYPLCSDCEDKLSGPACVMGTDAAGKDFHKHYPAHPEYDALRNRLYTKLHTRGGVRLLALQE